MLKVIKIILTVLVTSFYFFPITFTFLTIANTKNMMAALGIVFMIIELIKQRDFFIPKELLILHFIQRNSGFCVCNLYPICHYLA